MCRGLRPTKPRVRVCRSLEVLCWNLVLQIFKNPLKIPQKIKKNKELGDELKRVVLSQRGEEIELRPEL